MTGLGSDKERLCSPRLARFTDPPHQGANNFLVMSGIVLHFSDIAAFANVHLAPILLKKSKIERLPKSRES